MQKVSLILAIFTVIFACKGPVKPDYDGKFCSGKGDINYLRLIDESFAFLSPNPVVPNLSMIYQSEWNTFEEGAGWNAWWIQNSYGFSYAATPFRMDAPWTQRGENTSNLWYDKGFWLHGEGVAIMVDNFAIPAAVLRGLFEYDYKADRLILRPRVPGSISQYTQKEPVRFGEKCLYISCSNGGPQVKSVKVNGKRLRTITPDEVALMYNDLPAEAKVEIVTEGGPEQKKIASLFFKLQ